MFVFCKETNFQVVLLKFHIEKMCSTKQKYRIYIDEVGNSDFKSSTSLDHRYLSLTGIIYNLNSIKDKYFRELELLKETLFNSHPDDPVNLHRKDIINKRDDFRVLFNPEIEKQFNKQLIDLLANWEYYVISVLIDKKDHEEKYSTYWKYDPYHYAMEIITDRFIRFLREKNAIGDLMFETRGGKEDMRLKQAYRKIFEDGTHFIAAKDMQYFLTSGELKIKPKAANIVGLQIADLLAYPSRKFMLTYYQRETNSPNSFSDKIIEILVNEKYCRQKGMIDGYGINLI